MEDGKKTATYVIAHAKWRRKNGLPPSESYRGEGNPIRALAVAHGEIAFREMAARFNGRINDLDEPAFDSAYTEEIWVETASDCNAIQGEINRLGLQPGYRSEISNWAEQHLYSYHDVGKCLRCGFLMPTWGIQHLKNRCKKCGGFTQDNNKRVRIFQGKEYAVDKPMPIPDRIILIYSFGFREQK